jgi:ATP/ADP translocase
MTNIYVIPEILILFIGLWYSSVHVLNQSLVPNIEHSRHHTDNSCNFGPSQIDFMFGTLNVEEGYTADYQVINGVVLYIIFDLIRRLNSPSASDAA